MSRTTLKPLADERREGLRAVLDEHATMLRAAAGLDKALLHRRRPGVRTNRARLLKSLSPVTASIREHCASTEGRGGTLAGFEVTVGGMSGLSTASQEHQRLTSLVTRLLAALQIAGSEDYLPATAYGAVLELIAGIGDHCRHERDLLQLQFSLDVGNAD